MKKNLVNVTWDNIDNYSDIEISYFLFLEGKSIEAICRIRALDKITVQKHIIDGKIKYRFLAKSSNEKELFKLIIEAGKEDRLLFLKSLELSTKNALVGFIKENYADMRPKYKEKAVWILGELKANEGIDILLKASVHKFVSIRRMAVSAMGKIGDTKCEIALIRALDDENPQVVLYAIKALYKLKSTKAMHKIKYIKDNTQKEYLKNAAKDFLE
ncbi:HEAT repeat domain-containing protein [Haloimpatiens sp. FM7330]|uniref:HEAT repeat domain-containing protein n=1 Tax=Haloimpatiens sp. FM7330 TaxID=3298610 RepID=UPI003630C5D5